MHALVESHGGMSLLDRASANAPFESQSRADIVYLVFYSSLHSEERKMLRLCSRPPGGSKWTHGDSITTMALHLIISNLPPSYKRRLFFSSTLAKKRIKAVKCRRHFFSYYVKDDAVPRRRACFAALAVACASNINVSSSLVSSEEASMSRMVHAW